MGLELDSDDVRAVMAANVGLVFNIMEDGKVTRKEAEAFMTAMVVGLSEKAGAGMTREAIAAEVVRTVNDFLSDLFTRDADELEARAAELERKGKSPDRVARLRQRAAEKRAEAVAELAIDLEDEEAERARRADERRRTEERERSRPLDRPLGLPPRPASR